MDKLYLVVVDGHTDLYGASIYSIGIYDSKDKAELVEDLYDLKTKIIEIPLNKILALTKDEYGDYENSYYLGGYIE